MSVLSRRTRRFGLVPVALAAVFTLTLGGLSMSRAVTPTASSAQTDLEFSLDGQNWTTAPDSVIGSWGCTNSGGDVAPNPGPVSANGSVNGCEMNPGDAIFRTYYVRNMSATGRAGTFSVGVGDYVVTPGGDFHVESTVSPVSGGPGLAPGTAMIVGKEAETASGKTTAPPGSTVSTSRIDYRAAVRVMDTVMVPEDTGNYSQRQVASPMMWISFSADPAPTTVPSTPPTSTPPTSNPPVTTPPTSNPPTTTVSPGGGSLDDLPKWLGPLIGIGLIGGIIAWLAGVLNSGSLGIPAGSLGIPGLPVGSADGALPAGSAGGGGGPLGSAGGGPAGSAGGPGAGGGSAGGSDDSNGAAGGTGDSGTGAGLGTSSPAPNNQIPVDRVQPAQPPRNGAPDSNWVRANSQVRGQLANTGADSGAILLWALTALAAGITLVLFVARRREDEEEEGSGLAE